MNDLLIVFTKYPQPGSVKTRLAAELGNDEAVRVYRACTELLLSRIVRPGAGFAIALACWPPDRQDAMARWLGRDMIIFGQQGEGLGSRLQQALAVCSEKGYDKIIIIGSDCPALTHELLKRAFAELDSFDTVIGPAADGGYYLIGLRRPVPELFNNISWGTDQVCSQTLKICRNLHLKYALLQELRDIDRVDDLRFYRSQGILL